MNTSKKPIKLGEILLKRGAISTEQLQFALEEQRSCNKKLGEIIIESNIATEFEVIDALSLQTGIRFVNLDNYAISEEAASTISEALAKKTSSMPIKVWSNKILVAMSDPLDISSIEDIEMESGRKVESVFALKVQIYEAIEKYMSRQKTEIAVKNIQSENVIHKNNSSISINEITDDYVNNSPVVKFINSIINQALSMRASDIHIEPYEDRIRIRLRIDGELYEMLNLNSNLLPSIVTRIKVMSGMNIAEKRMPQDGRAEVNADGSTIDIRISIIPAAYGEKVVMRILDRKNFLKTKFELGFTEENLKIMDFMMKAPHGLILIAGPTGSGKTTSLYAYLNELNKINKNIITIEDPIEYKIDGVNQIQVNSKIGLTFANGLRSILRQDPDIIMIGEIRDEETAEIAVRSAITGHLVLSSIHTNDAPSTIIRLKDMGIKPYLIASSLRGVVAQRLVKKICSNCKVSYLADDYELQILNASGNLTLYKGEGCVKCNYTGYSSRIAVHEIMNIDKKLVNIINSSCCIDEIADASENNGMIHLYDNLRKLVIDGVTTAEEYSKVVYNLD